MKVTLHLEGTKEEIRLQVVEFLTSHGYRLPYEKEVAAVEAPPAASKRAPKAAKAAEPEEPQEEFNFGEEGEAEEQEEEEIDLDTVLVPAFSAFSKKSDKNKAKCIGILKSYKVKSVRDIPESEYANVMAIVKK